MKKRNFFQALATLTGTIIGVGLFSLPYITARVGIWLMLFYFLIIGIVIILTSLIYGEIVLRTKGLHRFPGYAEKYLGQTGKLIAFMASGLALTGAILAYLVVGGGFLASLFGPIFGGSYFLYVLIYFSFGAILIYFGIKSIARTEFFLLILFFVVLGLIFWRGFPSISVGHLFVFDPKYLFLPYGAVLFSLSTAGIIPELKEILKDNPASLKKVIFLGILIAILTYLFFIFIITGITGLDTSTEAITGLKSFLGNGIVSLALVFGLLTTFTSFLTLGLTLKKVFWYDFKLKKNLSWALACFTPLLLFVLGLKDFIVIISFVGGIALAVRVIITILIYLKAKTKGDLKPAYSLKLPRLLIYSLVLFFVLGIIYQIIYFAGI
jgi:tyrosine-specific transport protein